MGGGAAMKRDQTKTRRKDRRQGMKNRTFGRRTHTQDFLTHANFKITRTINSLTPIIIRDLLGVLNTIMVENDQI